MTTSKQLLSTLRAFHLDNPEATWEELRDHLRATAEDLLASPTDWELLDTMGLVYSDMREDLHKFARTAPLTAPQAKAVEISRRIMHEAERRIDGHPKGLASIIDELDHDSASDRERLASASLSVSPPQGLPATIEEPKPLSWEDLSDSYMTEHSVNVKVSTLGALRTAHTVIGRAFEAVGVSDLSKHKREDLIAVRTNLLESRKPSTVNNLLATLSTVLKWAEANDLIKKAYTTKLKLTKSTTSEREGFTESQVAKAMSHANGLPSTSWQRWGLSLLAITGARVGEIAQLTKEDIKQVDGCWCIDINERGSKSLKNSYSSRLVPLIDGALGFDLTAFLEAIKAGALPSDNGINPMNASRGLGALLREALGENRAENQTLHSLRHSMASRLQSKGTPLPFAQAILGHASGAISYDAYGNSIPIKALAEVLEDIYC
ncbi:tyrosine-type recombinase/integrase [Pseudomonas stutzeri]|uniref:tyrosine-type recombinase/integrase n=1 Tax=Stutzerimonas stutzeri TaxID=316 RepID=UPI00210DB5C4|nr:tyrosine-type recombinase/integrase [Stutzerimonas stutzeri]MCQ4310691.1 tyrosine-type recombinase/integrase [Stutzerimonas stutzeri]